MNNDQGSLSKESDPDSEDKKQNKEARVKDGAFLNEPSSQMDFGNFLEIECFRPSNFILKLFDNLGEY